MLLILYNVIITILYYAERNINFTGKSEETKIGAVLKKKEKKKKDVIAWNLLQQRISNQLCAIRRSNPRFSLGFVAHFWPKLKSLKNRHTKQKFNNKEKKVKDLHLRKLKKNVINSIFLIKQISLVVLPCYQYTKKLFPDHKKSPRAADLAGYPTLEGHLELEWDLGACKR